MEGALTDENIGIIALFDKVIVNVNDQMISDLRNISSSIPKIDKMINDKAILLYEQKIKSLNGNLQRKGNFINWWMYLPIKYFNLDKELAGEKTCIEFLLNSIIYNSEIVKELDEMIGDWGQRGILSKHVERILKESYPQYYKYRRLLFNGFQALPIKYLLKKEKSIVHH